jgi:hypothetical protein
MIHMSHQQRVPLLLEEGDIIEVTVGEKLSLGLITRIQECSTCDDEWEISVLTNQFGLMTVHDGQCRKLSVAEWLALDP